MAVFEPYSTVLDAQIIGESGPMLPFLPQRRPVLAKNCPDF